MIMTRFTVFSRSLDRSGQELPGAVVPITTNDPRRRERAGESGLRWGSFALRRRRDAYPMLLHRVAQRSYPQDK